MSKVKHQYRVTLIIQDDFHPKRDLQWSHALPAVKSMKAAERLFERVSRIIGKI